MERSARHQANLELRLQMLRLPVVPLERIAFLSPTDLTTFRPTPDAVSVCPDGWAVALWAGRKDQRRKQATVHDPEPIGRRPSDARRLLAEFETDIDVTHVQVLPGGDVLVVASRTREGRPNAAVFAATGARLATADVGDAIAQVLTTPRGAIWIGYFDESMGNTLSGVARFNAELQSELIVRRAEQGEPYIYDCYELNVDGEDARCVVYGSDPKVSLLDIVDGIARYLGPSPERGPQQILMQGRVGAIIGSYRRAMYDVVTPFRLTPDGVVGDPPRCRVVFTDGMETWGTRWICRGSVLHGF